MPKRKAEDKIKRYKEKIKRLEGKQNVHKRRRNIIMSDSDSDIENQGKYLYIFYKCYRITKLLVRNKCVQYSVYKSAWRVTASYTRWLDMTQKI